MGRQPDNWADDDSLSAEETQPDLSEIDTTVEQFDAMWDQARPVPANFVVKFDGNGYTAVPASPTNP